jgi:hypothetical protein
MASRIIIVVDLLATVVQWWLRGIGDFCELHYCYYYCTYTPKGKNTAVYYVFAARTYGFYTAPDFSNSS